MSAKVLPFPGDRSAPLRIDFCDPGPIDGSGASSGREPPHNPDAEVSCLSAVMTRSEVEAMRLEQGSRPDMVAAIDRKLEALDRAVEMLRPEMFHVQWNGRIWQACEQLRIAGTPIDRSTVIAWLRENDMLQKAGGEEYVRKIAHETPAIANVGAHAGIVRDLWERRTHIAAHHKTAAELYGDVGPWEARKAKDRAEWGRLTAPRVKLAGAPVGVAVQEARDRIIAIDAGQVLGVKWGPPRLSPHLVVPSLEALEEQVGLFVRKHQTVIAGISEHGKTALAGQLAIAIASMFSDEHGVCEAVYVLSGEMNRAAFVHRLACSLANVDAAAALRARLHPDASERLSRWLAFVETLPIIVDHEPAEARVLAGRIREHKRLFETGAHRRADGTLYPKCRMQLVIGDHAQKLAAMCSGCGPRADMKERLRAVSHGWQNDIAKALDVHTALLAQIGRKFLDDPKRRKGIPRKSDVEGASELEQDADTIQIVHRPELLVDDERDIPDEWRGVAAIAAAKRRFGGEGPRVVRMRFTRGVFEEQQR